MFPCLNTTEDAQKGNTEADADSDDVEEHCLNEFGSWHDTK